MPTKLDKWLTDAEPSGCLGYDLREQTMRQALEIIRKQREAIAELSDALELSVAQECEA